MAKRRAGKARWGRDGAGHRGRQESNQGGVGTGYDGGQGATQRTRLTARWREGQVEIKPNGMMGAERKTERKKEGERERERETERERARD